MCWLNRRRAICYFDVRPPREGICTIDRTGLPVRFHPQEGGTLLSGAAVSHETAA